MPSKNSSKQSSTKTDRKAAKSARARPLPPVTLSGIPASSGIAIGTILRVGWRRRKVPEIEIEPHEVEDEVTRFLKALEKSRRQVDEIRKRVARNLGEENARIFDAHLLILDDQVLVEEIVGQISSRKRNAEFIVLDVIGRYADALKGADDTYLKERAADIYDVADRIIANLLGEPAVDLSSLPGPRILAAHDLAPSDTATLDRQNALGFATELGSRTSHTAIMARALDIPAVVGVAHLMEQVRSGDKAVIDGDQGLVLLRPDAATLRRYRRRMERRRAWMAIVDKELDLPAETADGFRVQLAANVELADEVEAIRRKYEVGIGLFRTEFLFINRTDLPTEEDQFRVYKKVVEDVYPQAVIFRTFDIGGDKFLSSVPVPEELNPFLGLRAVRFCLSRPEIFKCQMRAILRASAYGKVRIMFPMVSTLEELLRTRELLEEAMAELDHAGVPYNRRMDVGTMIEVPSAALIAHQLVEYVDFFSIGTNDLIQYSLAVDRANPSIAYLYQPTHPAVVRLIRTVLEAAWSHGRWVSMCGEMAGDPVLVPLVLGLGIHELSMSPVAIGPVKSLIRRLRLHEAEQIAYAALHSSTSAEILDACLELVRRTVPELVEDREKTTPAGLLPPRAEGT